MTGFGLPLLVMPRSASRTTWLVTLPVLLAGTGSVVVELTWDVFVIVAPAATLEATSAQMMIVAWPEAGIVPSAIGSPEV